MYGGKRIRAVPAVLAAADRPSKSIHAGAFSTHRGLPTRTRGFPLLVDPRETFLLHARAIGACPTKEDSTP
jgi:hypothetical protein